MQNFPAKIFAKSTQLSSRLFGCLGHIQCSQIHTTCIRSLDSKWRRSQGLHANPNAFGPLTNLPDYTFMDGRPTPLGSRQKKRVLLQRQMATRIVQLSTELNFAKDRYCSIQEKALADKQAILDSKLKPKGHLLLKRK